MLIIQPRTLECRPSTLPVPGGPVDAVFQARSNDSPTKLVALYRLRGGPYEFADADGQPIGKVVEGPCVDVFPDFRDFGEGLRLIKIGAQNVQFVFVDADVFEVDDSCQPLTRADGQQRRPIRITGIVTIV